MMIFLVVFFTLLCWKCGNIVITNFW